MSEWKVDLLDDFDGVKKRVERTTRYIIAMLDSIRDRVAIERQFADALTSSALPATDDCYPSIVAGTFVFGDHSRRRAEHSRRFVANLESQIIPAISALIEHANEVMAPIVAEGVKIQKDLHQEYRAHDDSVISFDASSRVADNATVRAFKIPADPRGRLRAAEAAKLASERERLYAAAVTSVNRKRAATAKALEPVFDSLEAAEKRRLQNIEEVWRNFLAFEVEFTKSADFDLSSTLSAACAEREIPDSAVFIKSEIEEVTKKKGKPPGRSSFEIEMKPLTWLELQATMPAGKSALPAFPQAAPPAPLQTDGAARDWILAFLRPRVPGTVRDLRLNETEFSEFTKTAGEILDLAGNLKNYEAAKILWAVCRKIKETSNETAHSKIHEHSIFNETAFWEDAAASVVTDHFLLPQRRRSLAGSSESALCEFLHVGIEEFPAFTEAFGLASDFSRDLVMRVLDSHAELLGDDRSVFESAMISVSAAPLKVGKPARPAAPQIK